MRLAGIATGAVVLCAGLAPAAQAAPTGKLTLDSVVVENYAPYANLTAEVSDACPDGRVCKWFALIRVVPESKPCEGSTETRWQGPQESRDDQNPPYKARYLTSTGPSRERACLYVTEGENDKRTYRFLHELVYEVPASGPGAPAPPPPQSGTAPATASPSVVLTRADALTALRGAVRKRHRTTRGRALRCTRASSTALRCTVAWYDGVRTRRLRASVRRAAAGRPVTVTWRRK